MSANGTVYGGFVQINCDNQAQGGFVNYGRIEGKVIQKIQPCRNRTISNKNEEVNKGDLKGLE